MSSTLKQILFYLLIFLIYVLFTYVTRFSICSFEKSLMSKFVFVLTGIFLTLVIYLFERLLKPFNSESYCNSCRPNSKPWDISPAKLCSPGPYTWQGSSQRARMCRALYSTPEGRKSIDRLDCGSGYHGVPSKNFKFTPLSDHNWENRRCDENK